MIHETSYPSLFDRYYATILVEYELTESGMDVEWIDVQVTSLTGDNWEKTREELEAFGWAAWLNDKVTTECDCLISEDGWLKWELCRDD